MNALLFKMCPRLAMNDTIDCGRRHAVLKGEMALDCAIGKRLANGAYLLIGQTRARVASAVQSCFRVLSHPVGVTSRAPFRIQAGAGAVATGLSSLLHRVLHIVLVCSQEQMGRVDARGIVAGVAHDKAGGDRTDQRLVNPAMRLFVGLMANRELAVSCPVTRCRPYPAIAGFVNLSPKTGQVVFDGGRGLHGSSKKNPVNPGPRWCLSIAGIDGKGCGPDLNRHSGGSRVFGSKLSRAHSKAARPGVAIRHAASIAKRRPVTAMLRHSYYTTSRQEVERHA